MLLDAVIVVVLNFTIVQYNLYGNFLSGTGNCVGSANDNYEGFSSDYELNNGTQSFKALDLEIYHILF